MQPANPAASAVTAALRSDRAVTPATLLAATVMLIVSGAMIVTDGQIFAIIASNLPVW